MLSQAEIGVLKLLSFNNDEYAKSYEIFLDTVARRTSLLLIVCYCSR